MRHFVMELDNIDKNGDGVLDFDEFCNLVREREIGIHRPDDLRKRFDALDVDGSGTIDVGEFVKVCERADARVV